MRSEIAQPCSGPRARVRRIRRSRVPCGRSMDGDDGTACPLVLLQEYSVTLVEVQEESAGGIDGDGEGKKRANRREIFVAERRRLPLFFRAGSRRTPKVFGGSTRGRARGWSG